MKYDSEKLDASICDDMADLVVRRFRRGVDFKADNKIHQNLSFQQLIERADCQYRREYLPDDARRLESAYGFCPTRYYGLTQIKTNATRAWKRDMVVSNIDNIFTTFPSPDPDLDYDSRMRIRKGVERELIQRMADAGVVDPNMMLLPDGSLDYRAQDFLTEQVRSLKAIEQARLAALAESGAKQARMRLRDILVEGDFRKAYGIFTHQQILYGMGVMKFPDMQRRSVMEHSGRKAKRVFKVVPNFRQVDIFNIFPTGDGRDLHDCTGVTELTYISKIDLINLHNTKGYYSETILQILDDFQMADRNWLGLYQESATRDTSADPTFWDLDGTIPMLIHEGFFSGKELNEMGITGIKDTEYVNAEVVIVGGRTIKCSLLKSPLGTERTYYGVPFTRFGTNFWDVLGMGALLWDTEQRVNIMMHTYEYNISWAARPPMLANIEAFGDGVVSAADILPGQVFTVNQEAMMAGAAGRLPDPLKTIDGPSAQYHLLYTQIATLLRQADEECGIPAFAYGAQDFGRASLGEYSQRMSNALRTVKEAALEEDSQFIEPAFENMFARMMQEEPELAAGQDINMQVRGITGLLAEDQGKTNARDTLGMLVNLSNKPGLIPEEVMRYSVRDFLASSGIPVEALGMSDPVVDQAFAVAQANASTNPIASASVNPQVPQTDGRSPGIPQGAQADVQGVTNYGTGGGTP